MASSRTGVQKKKPRALAARAYIPDLGGQGMLGERTEALRSQHPRHSRSGNGTLSNVRDLNGGKPFSNIRQRRRLRVRAELPVARMSRLNARGDDRIYRRVAPYPADGRPDSEDGGRFGGRFVTL